MMNLKIEYDKDYGIDKRTGWSIAINGWYVVQFHKYLVVALIKAFYEYWLNNNGTWWIEK